MPEALLADLTLQDGLGARSGALLLVDFGQPVECRLLCRVPGLLALTPGSIAVPNGVRVGATVLAGAGAVLEEAALVQPVVATTVIAASTSRSPCRRRPPPWERFGASVTTRATMPCASPS